MSIFFVNNDISKVEHMKFTQYHQLQIQELNILAYDLKKDICTQIIQAKLNKLYRIHIIW